MYATINLPGSKHWDWYGPANRAECEEWLSQKKSEYQDLFSGNWVGAYQPARVITNREAKLIRYRDGSRVIRRPEEY